MSDIKRLDRIETKVDLILEHQSAQRETLAAQHVSLKEHMRRTDVLEKAVMPMVTKWAMVKGVSKFLGVLAVVAGMAEGFVVFLEYVSRHK